MRQTERFTGECLVNQVLDFELLLVTDGYIEEAISVSWNLSANTREQAPDYPKT